MTTTCRIPYWYQSLLCLTNEVRLRKQRCKSLFEWLSSKENQIKCMCLVMVLIQRNKQPHTAQRAITSYLAEKPGFTTRDTQQHAYHCHLIFKSNKREKFHSAIPIKGHKVGPMFIGLKQMLQCAHNWKAECIYVCRGI